MKKIILNLINWYLTKQKYLFKITKFNKKADTAILYSNTVDLLHTNIKYYITLQMTQIQKVTMFTLVYDPDKYDDIVEQIYNNIIQETGDIKDFNIMCGLDTEYKPIIIVQKILK